MTKNTEAQADKGTDRQRCWHTKAETEGQGLRQTTAQTDKSTQKNPKKTRQSECSESGLKIKQLTFLWYFSGMYEVW